MVVFQVITVARRRVWIHAMRWTIPRVAT